MAGPSARALFEEYGQAENRLWLEWLVRLRWVAIIAQIVTVSFAFGIIWSPWLAVGLLLIPLLLGIANLPAICVGFSTDAVVGFVLFQKVYTAFLHANVRIELGLLDHVVASPRFHRWHHDGDDQRGQNFASLFSFLDVLFGTFALPPGNPSRFGTGEPIPASYLGQLVAPLASRRAR